MTQARALRLVDPAGVWRVHPVLITPDGKTVAYTVTRRLDDLYVYPGIR